VYLSNNDISTLISTEAYKFIGGAKDVDKEVMLYNVRVGSKWLFDDYVETTAER
jgi:hypothetical protein